MRQNYDFFSLTGLPFDPPEKSQRQVEKAITKAMSRIQAQLCLETQQLQREMFQAQLDFLNQQSILINTTGWMEASKHFVELAAKRKKQEYERVQFTASLLVQNGIRSLDKGIFRSFRVKTGLSVETLTQVLEKSGIDLLPGASGDKLPHFPTNGERILVELEELRETKDPNPNGPDTSRVTDLYIFASYLMDDLEHADLYKNLSTSELKTVFDLAARKYSCRNDNLGKLCGSISSLASHYVFNSDNSRKSYEALMLYHHVALQSLFDALKILPSGILLQPGFAEKCIKLICVFFPDYETALSIYNKESNLTEVPYIPRENADSSMDVYREDKNVAPKCRIYGIDLGTTYSAIATLDDNGMPEVITNQDESSDLLASAVYFHDEANVVVGEYAKSQKYIEPERVVEFVKRYIGKPDAPTYEFDGVKYDPITISALILKRMKAYADAQGHCVENVVITCPAYFGNDEKAATRQAGIIAGLNVLNIVHEPTAAALNYCVREFKENRKIMVYDLGGGTFDITLFDFSVDDSGKAFIEVIKTGGNDRLGGIDWDARMFDYMSQKYAFEIGTEVSDMDGELKAIIRAQAEQAKKDLSALEKKSCTIKYDGDRTRIELTRQEFEDLTQDLVQQTMDFVHQLLSDVNFTPNDVDVVLLVGGSTYMPMIKNAVKAVFPGKVRMEQPNLAVAKGAALSAAIEWYEFERSQFSGEI